MRYSSIGERIGNKVQGCPSKSFISLWLLAPKEVSSYQEILTTLAPHSWEGNFPYTKTLEEAAQMNPQDFYKIFKDPGDQCLKTLLQIWPGH